MISFLIESRFFLWSISYRGVAQRVGLKNRKVFGLKMGSIHGSTKREVSTSEQKSQPWSCFVLKFLNRGLFFG